MQGLHESSQIKLSTELIIYYNICVICSLSLSEERVNIFFDLPKKLKITDPS